MTCAFLFYIVNVYADIWSFLSKIWVYLVTLVLDSHLCELKPDIRGQMGLRFCVKGKRLYGRVVPNLL